MKELRQHIVLTPRLGQNKNKIMIIKEEYNAERPLFKGLPEGTGRLHACMADAPGWPVHV